MILAGALVALATPALSQGKQAAAEDCVRLSGPATAAAPVSKQAVDDYFRGLVEARAACERAVIGPEPDPQALFQVAVLMQRDAQHALALEVFELAAEAGIAAAHTKIGDYYNFGTGDVKEDHARAVAEYRTAAEAGDLPAKATLAIMYQLGRGTSRDFRQMVTLLEESADAGYHFAQLRLAAIYMNPTSSMPRGLADELGLPDVVKAAEMLERASAQGNEDAARALKQLYSEDGPVTDPAQRAALIRRSAEGGDGTAINALGFLYERGLGVDYDPVLAASYYVLALETGAVSVNEIRGRIDGRAVDWDRDTAVEFQRLLQERGLYDGPLDGLVGGGTLGAARRLAP
ncbi:tetratricopeptide repeat protein [Maliponia aquimaris]|nr:tetratricopeptide repeat protein [Maliponia aquimaris]